MNHRWRILHLADTQYDSEAVLLSLKRKGIECDLVRAGTTEDFAADLERGGFDLIVADYSLYSFNDLFALELAQQKCPEVPFIFLSGAAGRDFARETLMIDLWCSRN